jgi:hypothetical protein
VRATNTQKHSNPQSEILVVPLETELDFELLRVSDSAVPLLITIPRKGGGGGTLGTPVILEVKRDFSSWKGCCTEGMAAIAVITYQLQLEDQEQAGSVSQLCCHPGQSALKTMLC